MDSEGTPMPRALVTGAQAQPPPFSPDVPASELHELLSRKLAQCGVMFDFLDCVADLKGKEVKRAALNELVECVGSTRGVLIEPVYPDIIRMVSTWPRTSGGGLGGHGTLLTCLWSPSPAKNNPPLFGLDSRPPSFSPLPPAPLHQARLMPPSVPPGPDPPCTLAYALPRPRCVPYRRGLA